MLGTIFSISTIVLFATLVVDEKLLYLAPKMRLDEVKTRGVLIKVGKCFWSLMLKDIVAIVYKLTIFRDPTFNGRWGTEV